MMTETIQFLISATLEEPIQALMLKSLEDALLQTGQNLGFTSLTVQRQILEPSADNQLISSLYLHRMEVRDIEEATKIILISMSQNLRFLDLESFLSMLDLARKVGPEVLSSEDFPKAEIMLSRLERITKAFLKCQRELFPVGVRQ